MTTNHPLPAEIEKKLQEKQWFSGESKCNVIDSHDARELLREAYEAGLNDEGESEFVMEWMTLMQQSKDL